MSESVLRPVQADSVRAAPPVRSGASFGDLGTTAGAGLARTGQDPMRKIIIVVGVAIAIFLLFTAYSVKQAVNGSAQLAAIKDLYFPVLERVDANIVRLDKMEEQYTQSVMTGERDAIANADELARQADEAFADMARLYPARADEVARLRASFGQYRTLAARTSQGLLDKTFTDIPVQTGRMNASLARLRTSIKDFRRSSYDNFVQTLQGSQQSARQSLFLGIALGVMNLGFMAVLVFFIRNNVKMMSVIALQNATLEQRVAERTAELSQKTNDIAAMLQHMNLGVCTVVPGNRIHPEYSHHLKALAGNDDLAGRDLVEALFEHSDLGADRRDQMAVALGTMVGEDTMMFDFNAHLLPREVQLPGADGPRTVQMEWSPIANADDITDKVLLIMQDVTHLRALEQASAKQRTELEQISRILRVPAGKFNEFVASALKLAAENRALIGSHARNERDCVATLFRNMHTIKGNARVFEFVEITDAAHVAEQAYDQLRSDPVAPWLPDTLLSELAAVEAALARYVSVNEDTLGRKGRALDQPTSRGAFVSNEDIQKLKALVVQLVGGGDRSVVGALLERLDRLGLTSLERIVSGSADALSSLARELGKPEPRVEVVRGDVGFNGAFAGALKSALMHIVRNSLDHGIESADERIAAGKPAAGTLHFESQLANGQLTLSIRDDGRGLALHKLRAKGQAAGLLGPDASPAEIAEVIFQSGVSTAEQLTQVSGRGVGMDAVRTFLREQGADIAVVLDAADTNTGFVPFSFLVQVPLQATTI